MGIILDLLIIATLIISIFIGYKRGLINVIFSLCAFIISLVITFVLYNPVTNIIIDNTEIDEKIEAIIIEKGISSEESEEKDGYLEKYISKSINEEKNEVVKSTARIITEKIIVIIVAVGLFIIIRLLLIFAKSIINGIASLPLIKQCDKLGGVLYGALIGIVLVYVFLAILFFVVSVNDTGTISNAIDSSYIAKILYSNNIILDIIF